MVRLSTNYTVPGPTLAKSYALSTGMAFADSKSYFNTGLRMDLPATMNLTSLEAVANRILPSMN
jgi:hypothetical protein